MSGETGLRALLRGMEPALVDGVYVFASVTEVPEGLRPRMVFEEAEESACPRGCGQVDPERIDGPWCGDPTLERGHFMDAKLVPQKERRANGYVSPCRRTARRYAAALRALIPRGVPHSGV